MDDDGQDLSLRSSLWIYYSFDVGIKFSYTSRVFFLVYASLLSCIDQHIKRSKHHHELLSTIIQRSVFYSCNSKRRGGGGGDRTKISSYPSKVNPCWPGSLLLPTFLKLHAQNKQSKSKIYLNLNKLPTVMNKWSTLAFRRSIIERPCS